LYPFELGVKLVISIELVTFLQQKGHSESFIALKTEREEQNGSK
jgi:hypothetical protein